MEYRALMWLGVRGFGIRRCENWGAIIVFRSGDDLARSCVENAVDARNNPGLETAADDVGAGNKKCRCSNLQSSERRSENIPIWS